MHGKTPFTFALCPPATQVTEISAEKMNKLLEKEVSGYVIQLCFMSTVCPTLQQHTPEMEKLLDRFVDVF